MESYSKYVTPNFSLVSFKFALRKHVTDDDTQKFP